METPVPVEPPAGVVPAGVVPVAAVRALVGAARVLERASGELSLAQYRVLASVAAGDERASRIAARLALGKPTISATVESLRQRGLLTRAAVDDDQRAAALRLTDDGQAILDAAERAMLDRLGELAARTPEPAAVLDALRALDGAVDGYLADRAAARGLTRRA
ncbi:winged helix-turn-helix transcriptional regulator [Frankia sp. AgB1.9]|uniref:MarR family winged helix-turn-helix transcriptional regulator n=1 Tax=unclassified Frankia TaxID=2632575 RepID=UPI001933721B|nr:MULTISPECIES: MarR family winged helix-turn-helix transcriptional regulator [unclassified Frankia]MBL7494286.1 winged helix-turn-helix transcriptional regulator [Frankia sp. AgW1.1]MBL7552507.1 winged helix-turn-helix transcriptional regulator [Frankia sp. AgB1.9]MBL7625272.1 winged helix-turn-helix transcriptional regulator [Frankia sp. AgB1.8]